MLHALAIETVRRNNRYLLLLSGALLAAALIIGVLSSRYYYNLLLGPFEVSAEALADGTYQHPLRYWYRVRSDQIVDTQYEYSEGSGQRRRVQFSYAAAQFEETQLLIQIRGDIVGAPRSVYEGFLATVSPTLQRGVIDAYRVTSGDAEANFLPVLLDVRSLGGWGYGGFILNMVSLLIGLVGVGITSYRNTHPQSHPMMKRLPSEPTLAEIDAELQEPHQTVANLHLTRNWLISQSPTSLQVMRYSDIVWMYKKMTNQSSYSVFIHDRNGNVISQRAKELRSNEIINLIHQRAPQAITAYDRDTESAWKRGLLKERGQA
jgi:hypothetical protein